MPEPTIPEMLEWLDTHMIDDGWDYDRQVQMRQAIRAILEQHRESRHAIYDCPACGIKTHLTLELGGTATGDPVRYDLRKVTTSNDRTNDS